MVLNCDVKVNERIRINIFINGKLNTTRKYSSSSEPNNNWKREDVFQGFMEALEKFNTLMHETC